MRVWVALTRIVNAWPNPEVAEIRCIDDGTRPYIRTSKVDLVASKPYMFVGDYPGLQAELRLCFDGPKQEETLFIRHQARE